MKKLIMQMQTSADGFQANSNGSLDWLIWNWSDNWTWDEKLKQRFNAVLAGVDTILLSGNMVEDGYIAHWSSMADAHPVEAEFEFAKKVKSVRKVVFSRTLKKLNWPNTYLAKGTLANQVKELKAGPGNDMIVFGGIRFVTALIQTGLIDEIQLFVNPEYLGEGLTVFEAPGQPAGFELFNSEHFDSEITILTFRSCSVTIPL